MIHPEGAVTPRHMGISASGRPCAAIVTTVDMAPLLWARMHQQGLPEP